MMIKFGDVFGDGRYRYVVVALDKYAAETTVECVRFEMSKSTGEGNTIYCSVQELMKMTFIGNIKEWKLEN